MPRGFDKDERRQAVLEERARRWRAAGEACPLTREQLNLLLDELAEQIVANGYDGTFALTTAWLAGRSIEADPVLAFFASHEWNDDFAVAVRADPHLLFGPSATRRARMPLDRERLQELM